MTTNTSKINKAQIVVSEELQSYIRNTPTIKNVYFDATGKHYLNVFKLRKDKFDERDPKEYDTYGTGLFSHQEVIPGIFNVDQKKESISKGDPETLIVAAMTREEILSASIQKSGNDIVSKIFNMSPAEKAILREALSADEKPATAEETEEEII